MEIAVNGVCYAHRQLVLLLRERSAVERVGDETHLQDSSRDKRVYCVVVFYRVESIVVAHGGACSCVGREPVNPEAWEWYHRVIGDERCPIVDTWWQTETGGILITPLPGATALKPLMPLISLPSACRAIKRSVV